MRMLGSKLQGLQDFPPRLRTLVEHLILSHHGRLEFGSPKVPQFPEALLLHHLDDLDSKMECMRALVQNDRQVDGCFTSYSASLERTVLKMERYWADDQPVPARAMDQPAAAPDDTDFATAPANGVAHVPTPSKPPQFPESQPHPAPGVPHAAPVPSAPAPVHASAAPGPSRPPQQHPLFAAKPDSQFADKLRQALTPANQREN
jgi:hypothetical protein